MKLEEFLDKYRSETRVKDDVEYSQVTISQYTGVKFRGKKLGEKIGRKRQFVVDLVQYPNTLMFTRQGLKDGAIGFAPIEVHNCIVTENMPTLSVDTDIVDIDYLKRLLNSNYFLKKLNELTIVGSAQKSIHERDLLQLEIDIPSIDIQRDIAKKIISKEDSFSTLKAEIQNQKQLLSKFKQSILQEAIEGKLTADWREQNPNTESASELLNRIKEEKAQLIKDKKIKKEKALPPITAEEIPFELPDGWVWSRFQDITSVITCGIASTPKYHPKGRIFLSAKNVKPFKFLPDDHKFVDEITYQKIVQNSKPEFNDILITRVGAGIGETALIDQNIDFAFYVSLTLVKPIKLMNSKFLIYWLNSPKGIQTAISFTSGTGSNQGNLNVGRVRNFVIPIPPVKEQEVIVEKIKFLMQKCNALEAEIKTSEANAQMLMQAVLKEAFEGEKEQVEV